MASGTRTVKRKTGGSTHRWRSRPAHIGKGAAAAGGGGVAIRRQLDKIEADGGSGTLDFGRGTILQVTNLGKPYFADAGVTKGDVMRYYAAVSPVLLPIIKDRPLVLKRYPEGIDGPSFFQQSAGAHVPDCVRTARVVVAGGARAERIIGGDLPTLLYTVQIGTIAVHSWQTRVPKTAFADTTTIDLDPGDDVPFNVVVTLAKRVKSELDRYGLVGAIKTSGSSGLHVALPLPPRTVFDDAARIAALIANRVADADPEHATIERSVKGRPAGTVYVDALQNAEGKSVVAAYSVRAREYATVSAPLDWRELRRGLRIESFTIETMPARLRKVGDRWGAAMKQRNPQHTIDRVLRDA
jgi:bifunctional non-homologous end joining protein LigD